MENENLITGLIKEKCEAAKKGELEAAKWMLREFRESAKVINGPHGSSHNIHPEVVEYFSVCFGKILEGKPIKKALNLIPRRGRPNSKDVESAHIEIATKVAEKMIFEKIPLYDAALEVSEQCGLHESKVQDAYTRYKSQAFAALTGKRLDKSS